MACILKAQWNSFALALFLFIPPTLHPSSPPPPPGHFSFLPLPPHCFPSSPPSFPFFLPPHLPSLPCCSFYLCIFHKCPLVQLGFRIYCRRNLSRRFFPFLFSTWLHQTFYTLLHCVTLGTTGKKISFNLFLVLQSSVHENDSIFFIVLLWVEVKYPQQAHEFESSLLGGSTAFGSCRRSGAKRHGWQRWFVRCGLEG